MIRIANFFLLAGGLAVGSHAIWLGVIVVIFVLMRMQFAVSALFFLLKRLRWLLLSLFILHLWFSSPELTWIPSPEGLWIASERLAVILAILISAQWLVNSTSTADMIAALRWWLTPLKVIGFSADRIAVRLVLIFDTVHLIQDFYHQSSFNQTIHAPEPINQRWAPLRIIQQVSNRVIMLFMRVFAGAETTPLHTIELPELQQPPLWQWSVPFILSLLVIIG